MGNNVLLGFNNNILLITSLVILLVLFFGLILKYLALKKRHKLLKLTLETTKKHVEWYSSQVQKHVIPQTELVKDTLSENSKENISPSVELTINANENKMDNIDDENLKENEILIQENVYYLPFPDKEKTYYAPEASSVPKADTFYKIEEENLLIYDNISTEQMNAAMNFVENHIKRVCVIQNAREPFHTKVIMISPGKVIRKADDYLVTDKIRVLYA